MAVSIFMAAAAAASQPALPTAKPLTAQQIFDSASDAASRGECESAVKQFEAIESRPAVVKSPNVRGSIAVRKGLCLLRLAREEEGMRALTAGLADLAPDVPELAQDRLNANFALGQLAILAFDYAKARSYFTTTLTMATSAEDQISAELWLARTAMFDGDSAAERHAAEALRLATATSGTTKLVLSDIHTVHARALLNRGLATEALAELRDALKAQGGLTTRVTRREVATRGDLALAALLARQFDSAREYLAWTGAGRTDTAFSRARKMEPPPCGGPANLAPDDSAVIEFSVTDQGSVRNVQPIWASKPGPAALEFARAVKNWAWSPADMVRFPAFFRLATRVEVRCTNGSQRPSISALVDAAAFAWVDAIPDPVALPDAPLNAPALPLLRAAIAAETPKGDRPAIVPLLMAAAGDRSADEAAVAGWLDRIVQIARKAAAPPAAIASFAMSAAEARARSASALRQGLRALLADPLLAADAETAATLRLLIAQPGFRSEAPSDAGALVDAVVADTRIADGSPLRVAALLRAADIAQARGDRAAAAASFARTGLDATQCAIVAPVPAVQSYSGDFPAEAQRWGFEGWVRFETDVTAEGRSANQRAIIAYPPFVFREAALDLARSMRFTKSYRPEGGTACSAFRDIIKFQIR